MPPRDPTAPRPGPTPRRPRPRPLSPEPAAPSPLDRRIAVAVAGVSLLLAALLLPPWWARWHLAGGVVLFAAVVLIARLRRGRPLARLSVFAVAGGGSMVFVPLSMGVMENGLPQLLGFGTAQAAALLWAVLRWEPRHPEARVALREALMFALFGAAIISAVATIPLAVGLIRDGRAAVPYLLVYPGYVAGFAGAAVLYWALQPIAHLATGRYLIGALAGACVYGAIAPLALGVGSIDGLREAAVIALVAGSLTGPPLALGGLLWR